MRRGRASALWEMGGLSASSGGFSRGLIALGGIVLVAAESGRHLLRGRIEWRPLLAQLEQVGVKSLSVVNLTAIFVGMVMALQLGTFLAKFGAKIFVSRIVGIALVRELGPVLAALMLAGRVGAGITAELGSMNVTEQIDALRALGANPIVKLVLPRIIALVIMLPLLAGLADVIGIAGAYVIAVNELGVSGDFYVSSMIQYMTLADVLSGIGKAVFFALIIGFIACYNGLTVTGGADGVGRATTSTVVASSISVLVADFFLTKLFLLL